MKLSTKIVGVAVVAVIVTAWGATATVYWLSSQNRVDALHQQMSVVLRQAETVAEQMDALHKVDAFDLGALTARAKNETGGRPLGEAYRETSLYNTIPIVASWKAAEKSAREQGYDFFTPSNPEIPARNPKNNNGADFARAFAEFAAGKQEAYWRDEKTGDLFLARAVRLTASCLVCHGDPKLSRTHDGKDPLGAPMENLKVGDLKGAFVLQAPMTGDPVVSSTMVTMIWVSAILLGVIIAAVYAFTRKYIVGVIEPAVASIDDASTHSAETSAQIAAASETLARDSSSQAAALEETSASLEELSSTTRHNADYAAEAKATANQARASADTGCERMQRLQEAMAAIETASNDVAAILKTIDEISFQTNILALNAAVEAARAGEHGVGFAVVADEVRVLAQRSAQAAKETEAKIQGCALRSREGVQLGTDVAASFFQILEEVKKLDQVMGEIATAAHEQSQGIDQVNKAISEMDRTTQASAAHAEQSASAAEELRVHSLKLTAAVASLTALVSGRTNSDVRTESLKAEDTQTSGAEGRDA